MKKKTIYTIVLLLIFSSFNLSAASAQSRENKIQEDDSIVTGSILFDLDSNEIISDEGDSLEFTLNNLEENGFQVEARANEVIIYVPKKIKKQGGLNVNGLKKHVANVEKNMNRLDLISHVASLLVIYHPIGAVGSSVREVATYIVDKTPLEKKKSAIRNNQSLYWVEVYANGSGGASIQTMTTFSSKPVRYVYSN